MGSAGMAQHMRNMLALFPPREGWDIAFVLGVRHPLDSVQRHVRADMEQSLEDAGALLDEYAKLISAAAQTPDARLVVFSYERLVRSPKELVRRVQCVPRCSHKC